MIRRVSSYQTRRAKNNDIIIHYPYPRHEWRDMEWNRNCHTESLAIFDSLKKPRKSLLRFHLRRVGCHWMSTSNAFAKIYYSLKSKAHFVIFINTYRLFAHFKIGDWGTFSKIWKLRKQELGLLQGKWFKHIFGIERLSNRDGVTMLLFEACSPFICIVHFALALNRAMKGRLRRSHSQCVENRNKIANGFEVSSSSFEWWERDPIIPFWHERAQFTAFGIVCRFELKYWCHWVWNN